MHVGTPGRGTVIGVHGWQCEILRNLIRASVRGSRCEGMHDTILETLLVQVCSHMSRFALDTREGEMWEWGMLHRP
jgi:hypothetical protein